jgi:hypothetical protein
MKARRRVGPPRAGHFGLRAEVDVTSIGPERATDGRLESCWAGNSPATLRFERKSIRRLGILSRNSLQQPQAIAGQPGKEMP